MSRRDVELVRAGYAAFLSGDLERAFAVFADDIEAYDDPSMVGERVYRGKDGFGRMLESTTEGFEDVRYFADRFIDAGEAVLVEARRTGRGQASGATVEEHQYHVLELQDGLVTRFRLFLSKDDALRAAGLAPHG